MTESWSCPAVWCGTAWRRHLNNEAGQNVAGVVRPSSQQSPSASANMRSLEAGPKFFVGVKESRSNPWRSSACGLRACKHDRSSNHQCSGLVGSFAITGREETCAVQVQEQRALQRESAPILEYSALINIVGC